MHFSAGTLVVYLILNLPVSASSFYTLFPYRLMKFDTVMQIADWFGDFFP